MNKLADVYPNWELFATQLTIQPSIIQSTAGGNERSDRTRFLHVLHRWRDCPPSKYPFTLESAVAILKTPSIGMLRLAQEIEQGLNSSGEDF